jgi:hypothetical protein
VAGERYAALVAELQAVTILMLALRTLHTALPRSMHRARFVVPECHADLFFIRLEVTQKLTSVVKLWLSFATPMQATYQYMSASCEAVISASFVNNGKFMIVAVAVIMLTNGSGNG